MKFQSKELKSGRYGVCCGKKIEAVYLTEREAKIASLHATAVWHQQQIDKVDRALDEMGELSPTDPHGYMA